jgi:Protein of unknown function (DUF3000)
MKPAEHVMTSHTGSPRRPGEPARGPAVPGEAEFRRAVAEVDAQMTTQRQLRPELGLEPEDPPRRLAPLAYALAATVYLADLPGVAAPAAPGASAGADGEIGWGRFVLLFDAGGQPGWDGKYRIIGYVQAELEPELAADPLVNEVGWSWLTEALDGHTTGYRNISGTVTAVVTQGFGSKQDEPTATGFELRASWSPAVSGESAGLAGHLAAWCEVVCTAAGLPPLAPGVAALRSPGRRPRP